ncbi:hypothetical protein JXL19_09565 [bacterium]|nr:hypothetical protein [bacterium]
MTGAAGGIGAKVGAKVGKVGVIVGARAHHGIAPGKDAPPVKGTVGAVVGVNVAVGQNKLPPGVGIGTLGAKGRVGATRVVNPGASVVVVGAVVKGGKIIARLYDDTRLKIAINNKLMNNFLNDLICSSPYILHSIYKKSLMGSERPF